MSARDEFADQLSRLREARGGPSYEVIGRRIQRQPGMPGSRATFQRMLERKTDALLNPEYVRSFVVALGLDEAEAQEWEERRRQVVEAERQEAEAAQRPAGATTLGATPAATQREQARRRWVAVALGVVALLAGLGVGSGWGA